MNREEFLRINKKHLDGYIHVSQTAGIRSDYVQGGGGNTSCKLDERLMAIKASGIRLDQVTEDQGYAVLDYDVLRDFYEKTDPSTLDDIEKQGSAKATAATMAIDGLPQLRPSVEAGFHSLLETFVLHTHPVYANLAACAAGGQSIVQSALSDLPAGHIFVPYINPGAQLTFAIGAARQAEMSASGRAPAVIFLENHGLIITSDSAADCLELHDQVNDRIARAFGTDFGDWPEIKLEKADLAIAGHTGATSGESWISKTPWLREHLFRTSWDLDFFTRQALYPDQIVFLNGQTEVIENAGLADTFASGRPLPAKCTLFRSTGEVFYRCNLSETRTIEQTLCAILFIHEKIKQAGHTVKTMNAAGRDFISHWESEQYRRQVAAQSGKKAGT